MSHGLSIALVGASGAVGADLLQLLPGSGLPVGDLALFAGPSSVGESVEVGERSHRLQVLPPDPLESPVFDETELAIFAAPAELTREVAPLLAERGVAVVDIGGALAGQAPMAIARVAEHGLDRFGEARMVSTPSAPAVLAAHLLGPLEDLGLVSCRGTVLLPASTAGRAGIAELSGQVVSLFNSQDPPRRVFPQGLAFDVLTQVGAGPEDWSPGEQRLAAELAALVRMPPEGLGLTTMVGPWFGGMVASLFIEFAALPDEETLRQSWRGLPGVREGGVVPGPRRVIGTGELLVGRVRMDPVAQGVHVVAVADNLRFGASQAALGLVARLLEESLL